MYLATDASWHLAAACAHPGLIHKRPETALMSNNSSQAMLLTSWAFMGVASMPTEWQRVECANFGQPPPPHAAI